MEAAVGTSVQTASEPRAGLEARAKPAAAMGQVRLKLLSLAEVARVTLVVRRVFGPATCVAATSTGPMAQS